MAASSFAMIAGAWAHSSVARASIAKRRREAQLLGLLGTQASF